MERHSRPAWDDDEDVRPHPSPLVRAVLVAAGLLSIALGIIGIVVPVLPTVPFLILAAACFARASDRLYRWLAHSRRFGPHLREWRRHRSIAWRTKLLALAMMAAAFSVSVLLVEPYWLKAALAALAIALGVWLYRIPSRDAPRRSA